MSFEHSNTGIAYSGLDIIDINASKISKYLKHVSGSIGKTEMLTISGDQIEVDSIGQIIEAKLTRIYGLDKLRQANENRSDFRKRIKKLGLIKNLRKFTQ